MTASTVSPAEVDRFNALADRWWDRAGPMRPLHAMNPARIAWIAARCAPAAGQRLLDVGCGAGLAAEALALRGFDVLGIDAAEDVIAAAEDLLAEGARFPVITALEVIEHVPDPAAFVEVLVALLAPGGKLFLSTLNRTARSLLIAKLGAEYVLRLLPVGTHAWRQFLTPVELGTMLREAGARVTDTAGLSPGATGWRATRDLGVNYLLAAEV